MSDNVLHVRSQHHSQTEVLAQEIQIIVEEDGTDNVTCISGHHPCRSLSYVFEQTLNSSRDGNMSVDYAVTVTYDQLMPSAQYITSNDTNTSIIIRGDGETKLKCRNGKATISFSPGFNSQLHLEWESLYWCNCTGLNREPFQSLNFSNIDQLVFNRVTFYNYSGYINVSSKAVKIQECSFLSVSYSSPASLFTLDYYNTGIFTVRNSTFHVNNIILPFYSIRLFNHSNAIISAHNCTVTQNKASFIELSLDPNGGSGRDVSVEISKCTFTQNVLKYVYNIAILNSNACSICDIEAGTSITYTISNNLFQGNTLLGSLFCHNEHPNIFRINVNFAFDGNHFELNNVTGTLISVCGIVYNFNHANSSFWENTATGNIIDLTCRIWSTISFSSSSFNSNDADTTVSISTTNLHSIQAITSTTVKNCSFVGGMGTALSVKADNNDNVHFTLTFEEQVIFSHNSALYGGGLYARNVELKCSNNASLQFDSNAAHYGGAIFGNFSQIDQCKDLATSCSIKLANNTAAISGQSIFTNINQCSCFEKYRYNAASTEIISSLPSVITPLHGDATLSIFPGKEIMLRFESVLGCLNSTTSCVADTILVCFAGRHSPFCNIDGIEIRLDGVNSVLITSGNITTDLRVKTSKEPLHMALTPSLTIRCHMDHKVEFTVTLNITHCPNGLKFNMSSMKCECATTADGLFICSEKTGVVCVRSGYWFGSVENNSVILSCQFPYCSYTGETCPSTTDSSYILLLQANDSQCLGNGGGTLCRECSTNFAFTFEATLCIPDEKCEPWQKYALLVLPIVFQLTLTVLLIMFIILDLQSGAGYLYAPLFCVATISSIYQVAFPDVQTVYSVFSSIMLLNLKLFGYIPWCFFQSLSPLECFAFHFLGPTITIVMVMISVMLARTYPRFFFFISKSPVKAICLLLLLSFWSLADTTIQVLGYVTVAGADGIRVAIQPDLRYLSGVHIPFWIVSVLVLAGVIIPFALLLLVAPLLSRRWNLTRIKPLLDEFQSCYHDNYRWYSAVYFIAWLLVKPLVMVHAYNSFQTLLVVLTTSQIFFSPYASRWLNVADSLLLLDLVIVSSSVQDKSAILIMLPEFLFYILLLLPLVYITLGFAYFVIKQTGFVASIRKRYRCRFKSVRENCQAQGAPPVPVTFVDQGTDYTNEEREPLLGILADEYEENS